AAARRARRPLSRAAVPDRRGRGAQRRGRRVAAHAAGGARPPMSTLTSIPAPTSTPRNRRRRPGLWAIMLVGLLAASVLVSLALGPADISVGDIWRSAWARLGLGETDLTPQREGIVWEL